MNLNLPPELPRTSQTAGLCLLAALAVSALSSCDKIKQEWKTATTDQPGDAPVPLTGRLAFKLMAYDHGKLQLALPLAVLQKRVNGSQPRVSDPLQQTTVVYEGMATEQVLDSLYGTNWRTAATVALRTAAGLPVLISSARLQEHRSFLVWRRMDRPDFVIARKGVRGPATPAGPLYLVWENIQDEVSRREGALGWVPGVQAIDLVDARADAEALKLPDDVAAEISSGAQLFRSHCLQCHTLNGVGNPVGPELNYPASVTEYFAAAWLIKYIDRPSQVRYGSAMPGLPGDLHERDKAIQHVVAYLSYMAKHKAAPVATEAQPVEEDSEASSAAPASPAGPATPESVRE